MMRRKIGKYRLLVATAAGVSTAVLAAGPAFAAYDDSFTVHTGDSCGYDGNGEAGAGVVWD
ncbi:hypothetical protein AB4212_50570, partial [Streptomyces sp. 2MCAF27]